MKDRLSTRRILKRTNEVFFWNFGKLVAPALIAAFLGYWSNWGYGRVQHWLAYALWRHFHGNVNAAVPAVVIPGVALRIVLMGVTTLLWGTAYVAISQIVVSLNRTETISAVQAYTRLLSQPGWGSLLWRLCWRLVIPGFLFMTAVVGPAGYWILTKMHLPIGTVAGKFESEILSLLLFGLPYLLYA